MKTHPRKQPNPIDVRVGKRVRLRRTMAGMSQTQLAKQLDLTFQQLQKYESGANRISASRLWAIAQIFDVPVGWFFEEDEAAVGERTGRETIELVRSINRLPDEARKRIRALVTTMARVVGAPEDDAA